MIHMSHMIWTILYGPKAFRPCDTMLAKLLIKDTEERNKAKQVREMSDFLEADLDDATVQKIAKHCTFDNLKGVKSFDLSIRIKEFNDCLPFKLMRVSLSIFNI